MSLFPERPYPDAGLYADAYFDLLAGAVASVERAAIVRAAELLVGRVRQGGRIFACGNGGSAAIANHLVCDHLKGIRTNTALRPQVHSFSSSVELITAIANDIGAEEMFSFQLSSMACEADVLIAISSSGNSPNILRALEAARAAGMATIAMTGFDGGQAADLADVLLHVKAHNYGVVEDVHQSLMHILAQFIRHANLEDPSMLGRVKF